LRIQSRFWRVETNKTKDLSVAPNRVAINNFDVQCGHRSLVNTLVGTGA
jgi:hypothetical protein